MTSGVHERIARLQEQLDQGTVRAFLSVDADNQTYLTGFRALLYSRPIVLVVTPSCSTLIVPELEAQHAMRRAHVDVVLAYRERPGDAPSSHLPLALAALDALPAGDRIGVERERLPMVLASELQARWELDGVDDVLRTMRLAKGDDEIAAIRASAELVETGVRASIDACRPGVTELEIDAAGNAAIHERAAGLGADTTVELLVMTPSGPSRSVLPHVLSTTRRIEDGDVLIHTRQVALNGYRAELERTLIVGEPSDEQTSAFMAMVDAQQAAMEAVGPGVPANTVDATAHAVLDRAGFGAYAVHRSGHGIGISVHEHPHLRFDNDEELIPGMVVTVEPGFYVPGLGGFRHSDTVLITVAGYEPITSYARSLEALGTM